MKTNQIDLKNVNIPDGMFKRLQNDIAETTLTHIYDKYIEKGRIGAATWREGMPLKPHYFFDSDVAKLIEAAAYSMTNYPNTDLKAKLDKVIEDLISIQEPDGYLNSYFHNVKPEEKWTDLRIKHELYCAGHLIEAAIAWKQATDEDKLLNAMCKYADLICEKFGYEDGQIRSWPGHQELELALVRLYHQTGNEKYLETSKFFVDDRGTSPQYWDEELKKMGKKEENLNLEYFQAHLPAREQETAEGHAVRACYFYSAMADIALETHDQKLLDACRKIWRNIIDKKMNVTGGVGSNYKGESFSFDYDLPEEYYYETCAQISLFFFAWRMFLIERKSEYADIMELTLHNSILSGLDATGKGFFYCNPLFSITSSDQKHDRTQHSEVARQEDFCCSCCPPNISRLIASIGQYVYAVSNDGIWINLFVDSELNHDLEDEKMSIKMRTNYPWDENVIIDISSSGNTKKKLQIRIPVWCGNFTLLINERNADYILENGYAVIDRKWETGDRVKLKMDMPVEFIQAHPKVRQAAGKLAIKRGPIVYCIEEVDNGPELFNVSIPTEATPLVKTENIAETAIPVIKVEGYRRSETENEQALYQPAHSKHEKIELKAIPYYLWANRGQNEMRVWINQY